MYTFIYMLRSYCVPGSDDTKFTEAKFLCSRSSLSSVL